MQVDFDCVWLKRRQLVFDSENFRMRYNWDIGMSFFRDFFTILLYERSVYEVWVIPYDSSVWCKNGTWKLEIQSDARIRDVSCQQMPFIINKGFILAKKNFEFHKLIEYLLTRPRAQTDLVRTGIVLILEQFHSNWHNFQVVDFFWVISRLTSFL